MYAAVSPAGPAPITTIAVPADASAASSGPDLWVEFTRVDPCGAGAAVHPARGRQSIGGRTHTATDWVIVTTLRIGSGPGGQRRLGCVGFDRANVGVTGGSPEHGDDHACRGGRPWIRTRPVLHAGARRAARRRRHRGAPATTGTSSWARGGYFGVDAFFVLSGFLITGLLLAEWGPAGRIDLKAFWIRRARRLLPAVLVVRRRGRALRRRCRRSRSSSDALRRDAFSTLGYVANWNQIVSHQSYFEQFAAPSPLRTRLVARDRRAVLPALAARRARAACGSGAVRDARSPATLRGAGRRLGSAHGGAVRAGRRSVARVLRHRHPRAVVVDRRAARDAPRAA